MTWVFAYDEMYCRRGVAKNRARGDGSGSVPWEPARTRGRLPGPWTFSTIGSPNGAAVDEIDDWESRFGPRMDVSDDWEIKTDVSDDWEIKTDVSDDSYAPRHVNRQ